MNDPIQSDAQVSGEIILLDAQGNGTRLPIPDCLELIGPDGKHYVVDNDSSGGFSAKLPGAGPFRLRATLENESYIFAFNRECPVDVMPLIEIPVRAGESDIQLFAWAPITSTFGHDPKVDIQFARDTAKGCIALHDLLLREGKSEAEAWKEVQRVLTTAFASSIRPAVLCKTCNDRYYTPGTPYYMNYPAYNTCMSKPPCT